MPTLPHRSSVTFLSACNCGRRQSTRDDPFNLLDANYAFYSDLENDCCRDLERTPVPIFQGEDDEEGQLQSLASLKKQTSTITAVPYMPTKAESTDEVRISLFFWYVTITSIIVGIRPFRHQCNVIFNPLVLEKHFCISIKTSDTIISSDYVA